MAKTVTVTLRIKTVGDGVDHTETFQAVNVNALPSFSTVVSTGNNGTYGPASGFPGMTGAVLRPPTSRSGFPYSSVLPKTLVGTGGDIGIPLDPAAFHLIPTASSGFGLTAGNGSENMTMVLF